MRGIWTWGCGSLGFLVIHVCGGDNGHHEISLGIGFDSVCRITGVCQRSFRIYLVAIESGMG